MTGRIESMPKVTVTYQARGRSNACVVPDDAREWQASRQVTVTSDPKRGSAVVVLPMRMGVMGMFVLRRGRRAAQVVQRALQGLVGLGQHPGRS